jgi:hypothetical protein
MGSDAIKRVDCGTCPVTLACAIDQGGNGYTFDCCGSTAVEATDDDGMPLLLIIDCGAHHFEKNEMSREMPECPLCSGEIADNVLLNLTTPCTWVPTVHAKVPVETRFDTWRRALPEAMERARLVAERKK